MTDDLKYEAAKRAIHAMYGDTSVPQSQTRENLEALRDDIDVLIDSLERTDDR